MANLPIHNFRIVLSDYFEMSTRYVTSFKKPAVSPFFCIFLEQGRWVRQGLLDTIRSYLRYPDSFVLL